MVLSVLDGSTLRTPHNSGSLLDVSNGVLLDTADYRALDGYYNSYKWCHSDEVMILVYDVFSLSDAIHLNWGYVWCLYLYC